MDSTERLKTDGDRRDTAAENSDTVALNKKRARRVSFAENTSVHFFDRDEEFNETSQVETAKMADDSPAEFGFSGLLERSKEFGGEDDGGDNLEDEIMEMQRSFLRPIGSPSSGGSTLGSASSNDEDNFFGPVSANFIRPGRLSDSAASDDNHDLTMDSTAFSMHFRSLAGSESGIDLKTPTGGQLFFEEKTPTNSNKGCSMDITLGKNHVPKSSVPATEVSGNHSSNDMSLVGENPNKYDYDRLSPGMDAILAESRKNLLHVIASDDINSISPERKRGQVSTSVDHGNDLVNISDSVRKGSDRSNSDSVINEGQSNAHIQFGDPNGSHGNFLGGCSPKRSTSILAVVASHKESHKSNSSPYQLSKDEFDSSPVASTSPVKQQQTLLTSASPSKPWGVTPRLPENLGSLLRNGSIEHHETETSIQKSISKLVLLEKGAFSSVFSAKVDKSTIKSLDFLKSPNVVEKNHDISRISFMEDSVSEEKLASVNQSTERNFGFHTDHARGENLLEKSSSQTMNGKSPNALSAKSSSAGKSNSGPSRPTTASPSKNTWSGNDLIHSMVPPNLNHEDSLLAEIAFSEGEKAITSIFVHSPHRVLDENLPVSPGLLPSQSVDFQSRFKQMENFDKGQNSTPGRDPAHINSNATESIHIVSGGMNGELRSPFVEVSHQNLTELRATDNRETDMHNGKEIIRTTGNFSTPAKENQFQAVHLDVGDLTNRDISSFEDNIPGAESRMFSHESVSPSAYRNTDQPRLHFPAGSPSRKEPDDKQPSRIPSPRAIEMSSGLENYSANKRNIGLLLSDPQDRTEITKLERSPKLLKSNYDPEKIVYSIDNRTKGNDQEKQKLADAYYKFTEDMKILIFGSADKLSSKMIDVLEDMLVHQQRLKVYEMLQHGVVPQSAIVHHDLQLEKLAQTKSLLHRVVFEKAKLQLKHVKRERLLKRLELLSSRMQDSQTLRANMSSLPLDICTSAVGAVDHWWLSVNLSKKHEVCHDKLTTMRQALEALDRKILTLTRTFHSCCKLKAEPGVGETITLVTEQLAKKTSCRFIRLDKQMWVVQGMASLNGQHNVILNHLDLIIQSIKIIVGPTSSVRSSFKLNETSITKKFPNMDACVAFGFVFNTETAHKYTDAKTLQQETQVTSALLGSLLDVIEEVQTAQTEFPNLTQSSFSSPSVDRLALLLCFFNFNSGRKVSITFDLSCLKQGIYPLEILPLQLSSPTDRSTNPSAGIIHDKIRDAIKDVRTGYMRILRLCRCVSQIVQTLTA